jgi:hypothetical protein
MPTSSNSKQVNMTNSGKRYKLLTAVALILGTAFACCILSTIISPEIERGQSGNDGEYAIDIDTALDSLAQGNINIFVPLPETPGLPPSESAARVNWSFTDLLNIAQAFHQWHWKETMNEWILNKLEYQVDCKHAELAPYFVWLELFRISQAKGNEIRFTRTIQISIPEAVVYWSETERYPVTENWQSIDLAQIKIPAEMAVKIAEENGGQKIRLSTDNNCEIDVVAPYLLENEWLVRYASYSSNEGWRYLLEVYVDKESGEFRIIHPE